MRRLIALIIMLIVPLQFAWAAAASLNGHLEEKVAPSGFHTHGHDHHANAHPDNGASVDTNTQDHKEDGHHDHCHHVFSSMLAEHCPTPDIAVSDGPILQAPETFLSRTPPIFDRPPLARA